MPMTYTQRKYALDRIEAIRRTRLTAIDSRYKSERKPVLSTIDKVNLIRARKAVFVKPAKPDTKGAYYYSPALIDCYDYPAERAITMHNDKVEADKRDRLARLAAKVQELRDSIILLDMNITPAQLDEFEWSDL